MKLLIDPCADRFTWAVKNGNEIVELGSCDDLSGCHAVAVRHGVKHDEVWIDKGYRTWEVENACRNFGWNAVKGSPRAAGGIFPEVAQEIEEATRGL